MSSSLRALCRAYADGHMSTADYRQQRTEVIALLLNSEEDTTRKEGAEQNDVTIATFVPRSSTTQPGNTQPRKPVAETAALTEVESDSGSRLPLIGGVVAVLVVIGVGVFMMMGGGEQAEPSGTGALLTSPEISDSNLVTGDVDLLRSISDLLLADSELEDSEIDKFMGVWELATAEQRRNWMAFARSAMADAELDGEADLAFSYDNLLFELGEDDLDEAFDDSVYERLKSEMVADQVVTSVVVQDEVVKAGISSAETAADTSTRVLQSGLQSEPAPGTEVVDIKPPAQVASTPSAEIAVVPIAESTDVAEVLLEQPTPAIEETVTAPAEAAIQVVTQTASQTASRPETQIDEAVAAPGLDETRISSMMAAISSISDAAKSANLREFRGLFQSMSREDRTATALRGSADVFGRALDQVIQATTRYNQGKEKDTYFRYLEYAAPRLRTMMETARRRDAESNTFMELAPDGSYTIQLLGTGSFEEVMKYSAGLDDAYVIPTKKDDSHWYIVVTGLFADRATAVAVIETMSGDPAPWAKSVSDIRKAAKF